MSAAIEREFSRLWHGQVPRKEIQRILGLKHDQMDRIRTRLGLPKRGCAGEPEPTLWRCECGRLLTAGPPPCPTCATSP